MEPPDNGDQILDPAGGRTCMLPTPTASEPIRTTTHRLIGMHAARALCLILVSRPCQRFIPVAMCNACAAAPKGIRDLGFNFKQKKKILSAARHELTAQYNCTAAVPADEYLGASFGKELAIDRDHFVC